MATPSTKDNGYNVLIIAGVFLLGAFICFLNSTFMNVALSDIMKDLNISVSTVQWLSTGYMLATGIIIPFTAFLIDKFKNRTLFFVSIGLFTIGTIIGAFATNFPMLLSARLIQGIASGIIVPLMQTVFLIIFPIEKRGFAMGIVGVVLAFAPAIGPTLSGWIINNYPWRYLFYVTFPFAVLDLILGYFLLKNVTENRDMSFDIISFIGSTIGFGGLLFGFSNAGNYSWTDINVYLPLLLGIVFLIIFIWRQLKMKEPMLNLTVFKSKIFTFSTIIVMIAYAGLISSELILPMYLEDVRGSSAFNTGLTLMPGAIVMGIMNPITGKLFDRFGARYLALTGLTILTLGTFGLSFLYVSTPIIYVISVYAIRMLGISMLMMPLTTSGLNSLHRNLYAHGNAANNTLRQVAGSIGTSIIVTLMSKASISSGYTDPAKAQVYGMNISFASTAALTLIGLIIAFFVIKKKEIKVKD
ncbi:MDR family MFS transporter [Clostridium sp. D53t1_180928_C8]|uniref:MDR family MFS transporter n=1 Tax=Clostridium sp. D53t1_180928_C8 TaxID=2787101 RepID=UPI0018AA8777|nr:MDR family MFS transporter [Clostridium sp. D53t1_180928_C8]